MYEHARFETKVLNNRINFHLVAKYILKAIGTKTKKKGGEGRKNENNPTKLKPFLYFHLSSSPPPPHLHMRNHGRRELKEIFVS